MSRTVNIAGRPVGHAHPVFIIAEIGCNFRTFEEAVPMMEAAMDCGADAVKIQSFEPETVATANAVFDMANTGRVPQREIFARYSIDDDTHERLYDFAERNGILLFTTPTHLRDLERLEQRPQPAYKIGSDDCWNLPFLDAVARRGRPVILSTGMSDMEQIRESVETILSAGNQDLVLLHCLSDYPADPRHVNLRVIETFRASFPELPVGYSDHVLGPLAAYAAVALGACVVEKHFTLSKDLDGPDHKLSADPAELREMVRNIRLLEQALGDGVRRPSPGELRNIPNNRKSVVAVADIPEGGIITRDHVDVKRPGDGIPPKFLDAVVGRRAACHIPKEASLTWEQIRPSCEPESSSRPAPGPGACRTRPSAPSPTSR